MRIALIQTKQNELYDFTNPRNQFTVEEARMLQENMIQQTYRLINDAIYKNCDLIVTSEAINYAGQPKKIMGKYEELIPERSDKIFEDFSQLALKGNCYLVAGVFYKEWIEYLSSYQLYNATLIYNRLGQLIHIYHKVHLAGEEKDYLTAGSEYLVFETEFGKIGVCICWDMQFPETSRQLAERGADLILCPTWGWEEIYGHARAYENGLYVASAMSVPYKGNIEGLRNPSEVISPEGKIILKASFTNSECVICEIDKIDCKETREFRLNERRIDTY